MPQKQPNPAATRRRPPPPPAPPKTPECDKLVSVAPVSQQIGNFIQWLGYNDMYIAEDVKVDGRREKVTRPVQLSIEQMLAKFFEIDLNKVENERRALLASLQ